MAKTAGMGDNLYIAGYDIGGDTSALGKVSGGPAALDLTSIDQSAYFRLGGERDGGIDFTTFHDTATGAEHDALSSLPLTDVIVTYGRGGVIGNPAASLNAKQVNYDATRGQDGSLTFAVSAVANGFGLEWGVLMTPDRRTDGSATPGSSANSFDTGASLAFGAQMYVHLFAFTGTSVTVKLQDSSDNISFADITGTSLTTTALTTAHTAVRVTVPNTTTIRRYIAVATVGTFSSADFAVQVTKNPIAGQVF